MNIIYWTETDDRDKLINLFVKRITVKPGKKEIELEKQIKQLKNIMKNKRVKLLGLNK